MGLRSGTGRLIISLPIVIVAVLATTLLGPRWIPLGEILGGDDASHIYWHLRFPRAMLGAATGAGLAVGGALFQTLFRNPLATPYTLGVASGASLAAAIGFLTGLGGAAFVGIPLLSMLAFAGAVAALGIVFVISRLRRVRDMTHLLLAGVCVAYMCSAGILLVTFLADRAVTNDIVIWLMGSLGVLRPRAAAEVAVVLVPVLAYALYRHRALDLLMLGDELAATRGVHVERTIWTCFGLIGLLTAVVVANCGPIGFVGLMVPHMARAVYGVRALPLIAGAALIGAVFLPVCDGLARLLPVTELPVGVTTNLVGAFFFFYLLITQQSTTGARQ